MAVLLVMGAMESVVKQSLGKLVLPSSVDYELSNVVDSQPALCVGNDFLCCVLQPCSLGQRNMNLLLPPFEVLEVHLHFVFPIINFNGFVKAERYIFFIEVGVAYFLLIRSNVRKSSNIDESLASFFYQRISMLYIL